MLEGACEPETLKGGDKWVEGTGGDGELVPWFMSDPGNRQGGQVPKDLCKIGGSCGPRREGPSPELLG